MQTKLIQRLVLAALAAAAVLSPPVAAHGGALRTPPRLVRPPTPKPAGNPLRVSGTRPLLTVHSAPVIRGVARRPPVVGAVPSARAVAPVGRPPGSASVGQRRGGPVPSLATQWTRVPTTTAAVAPRTQSRGLLQRTTRVQQLPTVAPKATASSVAGRTTGMRGIGPPPAVPARPARFGVRPAAPKDDVLAPLSSLPGLGQNAVAAAGAGVRRVDVGGARVRGYDRVPDLHPASAKAAPTSPIYDTVPPEVSQPSVHDSPYSKLPPPRQRLSARVAPDQVPDDVMARYASVPPEVTAAPKGAARPPLRRMPHARFQPAGDVARTKGATAHAGIAPGS